MRETGVLDQTVMVFGQMNEAPAVRFRVGHAAMTMAEYFRDDAHQDVLVLIDNIFRFVQAGSEVSGLLGRIPSRVGYQPTLGTELAELEERISSTEATAITSIQAVYVPADDFTDPAATHTFAHLSASIVLSRKRASQGLYPAIDPLQIGLEDADADGRRPPPLPTSPAPSARTLAEYEELKDIIAMLGLEELSEKDRAHGGSRPAARALSDAAVLHHRAVHRPGRAGSSSWTQTLDGCERILADEFADARRADFFMIGAIPNWGPRRMSSLPESDIAPPRRSRRAPAGGDDAAAGDLARTPLIDETTTKIVAEAATAPSACCPGTSTSSPPSSPGILIYWRRGRRGAFRGHRRRHPREVWADRAGLGARRRRRRRPRDATRRPCRRASSSWTSTTARPERSRPSRGRRRAALHRAARGDVMAEQRPAEPRESRVARGGRPEGRAQDPGAPGAPSAASGSVSACSASSAGRSPSPPSSASPSASGSTAAHRRISWTLTLLIIGVVLGSLNAWYWVKRESRDRDD